jgi:DNA-directed RNA polymerase specialized sigma24 family protein
MCNVPIGTVMSRLARARRRLQQRFAGELQFGSSIQGVAA